MNELYHHVTSLLRFECFPFGAGVRGDGGGRGEGRVSIILQSLFPLPLNSSVTHTSAKDLD